MKRCRFQKGLTNWKPESSKKRQELSRLERSSDNQLVELNALKTHTKGLNEEKAYLNGLISEYAQLFENPHPYH